MPETWTPTTEQVRSGYAVDPVAEYHDPITNHTAQNERAFDRWLAQHEREAIADAFDRQAELAGKRTKQGQMFTAMAVSYREGRS